MNDGEYIYIYTCGETIIFPYIVYVRRFTIAVSEVSLDLVSKNFNYITHFKRKKMTVLVRGTAHVVVNGLCKFFSFILMCEHAYFAYVFWHFASTKLAVEEFAVTDVDRK